MITDTISRTNIERMLKEGTLTVRFVKTDGTHREMRCTLMENLIKPYEKKTDREKKPNENVMFVFDLDKEDWRSFRLDSVLQVYK